MSVFFCDGCQESVDSDYHGHNYINGKELCNKCEEKRCQNPRQ
jgi:hypothetical protein